MAIPKAKLVLFDSQFEALISEAPELLISSSRPGTPAGASYVLRAAAIKAVTHQAGSASVLILQRNESEVYRNHVSGEAGLLAMVREHQGHGFATVQQDEVRFKNGGLIRWSGCSREAEISRLFERRWDVVLIDDAEDVPETVVDRLREAALLSPHPARRVLVASRAGASSPGWVGRRFAAGTGRLVMELDPDLLDPELVKRPAFPTYRQFLKDGFGGEFIWAPHTPSIVDAIDRWIAGEFEHLAIFIPSQHGKTEAGPRHAVPYLLKRFPSDWCAIVSYNAETANKRSADARENYRRLGGETRAGSDKVKEWITLGGGGCWSAGMGSGQTGNSNSWGFLDDPDEGWADAVNRGKQAIKRRRYGSTFRARESMFARDGRRQKVCATVTRWDPEDLVGYAMAQSHAALVQQRDAKERWGVLPLPAIYDPAVVDGYRQMYPLFEILDDFRTEVGQPIWPDRRTAQDWAIQFKLRGHVIASTECQQMPKGVERGGQFESEWFIPLTRDPAHASSTTNEAIYATCTRAWDLAGTEGGGDWTVGSKVGRTAEGGEIIVRHVARGQFSPRGVQQLIAACMIVDGPTVKIRIPIDPAQGGIAAAEGIIRYLREVAGWVGMPVPEIVAKRPRKAATATQTAKAARAHDFQSLAHPAGPGIPGGVKFIRASWDPSPANMVNDWTLRLMEHPELREIALKAGLFSGDWWTMWLQVFQSFTGDEGRVDDDVDATVDAYEEVYLEEEFVYTGAIARVPGWY